MAWTWGWLRKPVHSQIKSSHNPKKPHCAILKVWTLVLNISSWIMVCQFIWFGVGVWGIDHYDILSLRARSPQALVTPPALPMDAIAPLSLEEKTFIRGSWNEKLMLYLCLRKFWYPFKGKITYYHPQQLCYLLQIPIHARATLSLTSTTIIL